MPTKKILNPEIGKIDCPCCGAVVPIRINRNGCAYIYCNFKFEDGEVCYYRVTYGKKKSKELIEKFCSALPPETENNQPQDKKNEVENDAGLQENKNKSNGTNRTSGTTARKSIFRTIIDNLDD